jgi:hypothetical protein
MKNETTQINLVWAYRFHMWLCDWLKILALHSTLILAMNSLPYPLVMMIIIVQNTKNMSLFVVFDSFGKIYA